MPEGHPMGLMGPPAQPRRLNNKWPSVYTDSGISLLSTDTLTKSSNADMQSASTSSSRPLSRTMHADMSLTNTATLLQESSRRLDDEPRRLVAMSKKVLTKVLLTTQFSLVSLQIQAVSASAAAAPVATTCRIASPRATTNTCQTVEHQRRFRVHRRRVLVLRRGGALPDKDPRIAAADAQTVQGLPPEEGQLSVSEILSFTIVISND